MPYFTNYQDEDEENDKNGTTNFQVSGASPTTGQSGQIVQGAQGGGKPATGSGFTNLDKYLDANAGQGFGNEFVGKVGSEVTGAQTDFANASQKFKDQVGGANVIPTSEQISGAIADPTSVKPEDFQNWQKQGYKGYNNLSESPEAYNQYWSGANKAKTSAGLLGSEAGRFSLLDSYFGRPSYSFGEKSLDNMLVQRGGMGNQINDLQNQASLLQTQGKNQADALSDYAATQKGAVEASTKNANDAYNTAYGQATGAVEETLGAANAARAAEQQALKASVASGTYTPEQLAKLGLDPNMETYNQDISKYLTYNDPLKAEQVATPEQRARIDALTQLAGNEQTFLGQGYVPEDNFNFRGDDFKQAVGQDKLAYDRLWNTPTVQRPGETATSFAQMQDFVNQVKTTQANQGRDPNNPATWLGSHAEVARDYVNRIAEYRKANNFGKKING